MYPFSFFCWNVVNKTEYEMNKTFQQKKLKGFVDTLSLITEPFISITRPITSITEPIISITEPIISITKPIISITRPVVSITSPDVSITSPDVSIKGLVISIEGFAKTIKELFMSLGSFPAPSKTVFSTGKGGILGNLTFGHSFIL